MIMYRVQFGISIEYLGLLPYSERVILRVPQYTFFHYLHWFAGCHRDIFHRQLLALFFLKREFVHSNVQQYSQSRDTETVHSVLEHETSARDSSTTQLRTMQKTARTFKFQILRR